MVFWGPWQATELQHDRLLDAKSDGMAVASTVAPDPRALSARGAANKRHTRVRGPPAGLLALPPGSNIYFAAGTWEPNMSETLLEHTWRRVEDLSLAHVFVVKDPAAPPKMLEFVAALNGGAMINATFLACPEQGCMVRYRRYLRLPRYVWISDKCRAHFRGATALLEQLVGVAKVDNRWRWKTKEQMETRRGQSDGGVKERIALVLASEMQNEELRRVMGKTTMEEFVQTCVRRSIDTRNSHMGSCGR